MHPSLTVHVEICIYFMVRLIIYLHMGISLITWQLGGLSEELSRQGGQVMLSPLSCPVLFHFYSPAVFFVGFFCFTPSLLLNLFFFLAFMPRVFHLFLLWLSAHLSVCVSACLPIAVVLAPLADALIGIRRSARDLIQEGVSAGCLETDLASKALCGIKLSISVLSATCGQIAKKLWELLSEAKTTFWICLYQPRCSATSNLCILLLAPVLVNESGIAATKSLFLCTFFSLCFFCAANLPFLI